MRRDKSQLAEKIGAAAAVDGDMGDVAQIGFGFLQAIGDRLAWKPGPMLDPSKSFLFGGGDQSAVADDAGRRVGVVGVDPEYQRIRCHRALGDAVVIDRSYSAALPIHSKQLRA